MLQGFGEQIWTADGPIVSIAGFDYPTRMIVIRLSDGGLFVWSPTPLSSGLQVALDPLGPVRYILAPNALHHLFIGDWQRAYPEANIHGVRELRKKRPDIKWDSDLQDTPAAEWSGDIDQVLVRGNWITPEVVFFHRRSGTAIFTDLVQQFDAGWFKGWRSLAAKWDYLTTSQATVPRKFRLAFRDRELARSAVQRIMAWPTEKVLMAHGRPITHGGRDAIGQAFNWLLHR